MSKFTQYKMTVGSDTTGAGFSALKSFGDFTVNGLDSDLSPVELYATQSGNLVVGLGSGEMLSGNTVEIILEGYSRGIQCLWDETSKRYESAKVNDIYAFLNDSVGQTVGVNLNIYTK